MKHLFTLLLALCLAMPSTMLGQSDLIITGVLDATLTGGTPKAIEVYVVNDIADLSIYGIGSANNAGGSDGQEFTFPATSATAGDYIYVTHEGSNTGSFNAFLGILPDYINSVANINGDDSIELFKNGAVVDVFGEVGTDGSGEPWEYLDGWAYRNDNTGPDGMTFTLANWSFSGRNALDGETTNAGATTPFPLGTYASSPPMAATPMINEFQPNPTGGDPTSMDFEISGEPGTMFSGVILSIESDKGSTSGRVDEINAVSGTFDANGLLVVQVADFENPSFTAVLVSSFSGDNNTDIDTDNDGTVDDISAFGIIYDAIGIPDETGDQMFIYGDDLGGQDFVYTGDEPKLVFRDGATMAWYAINDPAGTDAYDITATPTPFANFTPNPEATTFGATNPIYTAPVDCGLSTLALTSLTCTGDDLAVEGSFVVVNGSGKYSLSSSSMAQGVLGVSGASNGTVTFSGTLTGPTSGTATFTIADLGAATTCEASLADVALPTCPAPADCGDLYIALVVDGPLSQGRPKVIKLCATDDIADLSIFGVGSANNGGGSDGVEFDGMTGPLKKDQCIFLTSHAASFKSYFAFDADYTMTGGAALINGDDAIELFCSNSVIDVFGDINTDGSGQSWDYLDSWAFRNAPATQNGGTFNDGNWTFGGPNALDIDFNDPDFTAGGADPLIPCIPIIKVTDPCACGKPENKIDTGGKTERFYEVLQVTITPAPMPVEAWSLVSTDVTKPIYSTMDGAEMASIPMTHIGGGVYEAKFWHKADLGYAGVVNNGLLTNPIVVTGACAGDCPLIPTMGQWALLILALMMSSLALGFMFNYKRNLVG